MSHRFEKLLISLAIQKFWIATLHPDAQSLLQRLAHFICLPKDCALIRVVCAKATKGLWTLCSFRTDCFKSNSIPRQDKLNF